MNDICYIDSFGEQKTRKCTPEEQAELDARTALGPSIQEHNAPILAALDTIDVKSIRPLREGDVVRVTALEQQAAALRLQLRKN